MTGIGYVPVVLATLALSFSLFEFFLWRRRPQKAKNLILSIMLFLIGAYSVLLPAILELKVREPLLLGIRINLATTLSLTFFFLWYLKAVSGLVSRRAQLLLSVSLWILAGLYLFLPENLVATVIQETHFSLINPLGVQIAHHYVRPGPLFLLFALVSFSFSLYGAKVLLKHARAGFPREALFITCLAGISFLCAVNDFAVITGTYHFAYLSTKCWFAMAALLAFSSWKEILDREESVDSLQRTEAQFGTVLKTAPLSIWMGDAQGRMLHQNEISVSLVGNRVGEILQDGVSRPNAHAVLKLNSRALAGEVAEDRVFYRVGNQERTYRLIVAPVREKGEVVGTFGFGVDITELVLAEQEKARLHAQLIQSQKMESLGLLAGGIAHDMNNILTAILAITSTKEKTLPPNNPVRSDFARIQTAAERGGKLLKSILSFARRSNGEEVVVHVNEIVQEALELLRTAAPQSIVFDTQFEAALKPIRGDANALSTVIMNLCGNALDAMPQAGTLTIVTQNYGDNEIEIRVQDTGVGMSAEVVKRAVEPFFTTKPEGSGTGLGLSQVYRIVHTHHGTLSLSSQPGKGTTVTIILPATAVTKEKSEVRINEPLRTDRRSLDILVVDDDDLIRSVVGDTLKALGHVVRFASGGGEALVEMEAPSTPDVVLLDFNMPGGNGGQVLAQIQERWPRVLVILSTGRMDQTVLQVLQQYPEVVVLPKPYTFEEIRDKLENADRR